MSDIVFLRAWVAVDLPRFYNPVTNLLGPAPKPRKQPNQVRQPFLMLTASLSDTRKASTKKASVCKPAVEGARGRIKGAITNIGSCSPWYAQVLKAACVVLQQEQDAGEAALEGQSPAAAAGPDGRSSGGGGLYPGSELRGRSSGICVPHRTQGAGLLCAHRPAQYQCSSCGSCGRASGRGQYRCVPIWCCHPSSCFHIHVHSLQGIKVQSEQP